MNLTTLNSSVVSDEIAAHHKIYDLPVQGSLAENIFAKALQKSYPEIPVVWCAGSHAPGSDVFVKVDNKSLGYSIKTAKQPQDGKWLKISSYRTTKAKELESKKNNIRLIENSIHGYVVFARTETKVKNQPLKTLNYNVYNIHPSVLNIDTFDIKAKQDGNYVGENEHGVKLAITNNMSSQLWFDVPMKLLNNNDLIRNICQVGPFEMKLWYQ